jgi:hypothetical protein
MDKMGLLSNAKPNKNSKLLTLLTVTTHVRLPYTNNVANFLLRTLPHTIQTSLPEFVSAHCYSVAYV